LDDPHNWQRLPKVYWYLEPILTERIEPVRPVYPRKKVGNAWYSLYDAKKKGMSLLSGRMCPARSKKISFVRDSSFQDGRALDLLIAKKKFYVVKKENRNYRRYQELMYMLGASPKLDLWFKDNSDFQAWFNHYAIDCFQFLVANKRLPKFLNFKNFEAFMFYRGRRIFSSGTPSKDSLSYMRAHAKPMDVSTLYDMSEFTGIVNEAFSGRSVSFRIPEVKPFLSRKSTCYIPTNLGGFNYGVYLLSSVDFGVQYFTPTELVLERPTCKIVHKECLVRINNDDVHVYPGSHIHCNGGGDVSNDTFILPNDGIDVKCKYLEAALTRNELLIKLHRDNVLYFKALNTAISLILRDDFVMVNYVSVIPEAALKMRVPAVPTCVARIVAAYIAQIGRAVQFVIFPEARETVKGIKAKAGDLLHSGDFIKSTVNLWPRHAIRVYYCMFSHVGLSKEIFDLLMNLVAKLLEGQILFSDEHEREVGTNILSTFSSPVADLSGYDAGKCGRGGFPSRDGILELHNTVAANYLETHKEWQGSERGFVTEGRRVYPTKGDLIELFCKHLPYDPSDDKTHITVLRGILMSLNITAPVLYVMNAVPHWKLKLFFGIKGDDNISSHRTLKSIEKLWAEQRKTGMIAHTGVKAGVGKKGVVLAEELYLAPTSYKRGVGKMVLQPNFAIKMLFALNPKPWDAISQPLAARQQLNKLDKRFADRVWSVLYARPEFQYVYSLLRGMGITPLGKYGLYPGYEPGYKNSDTPIEGLWKAWQPTSYYQEEVDLSPFLCDKKDVHDWLWFDKGNYTTQQVKDPDLLRAALSSIPPTSEYCPVGNDVSRGIKVPALEQVILSNLEDQLYLDPSHMYCEEKVNFKEKYSDIPVSDWNGFSKRIETTIIKSSSLRRHVERNKPVEVDWSVPRHTNLYALMRNNCADTHGHSSDEIYGMPYHIIFRGREVNPKFPFDPKATDMPFYFGEIRRQAPPGCVIWVIVDQPGPMVAMKDNLGNYLVYTRPWTLKQNITTEFLYVITGIYTRFGGENHLTRDKHPGIYPMTGDRDILRKVPLYQLKKTYHIDDTIDDLGRVIKGGFVPPISPDLFPFARKEDQVRRQYKKGARNYPGKKPGKPKSKRPRRICNHFVEGNCLSGHECRFSHDASVVKRCRKDKFCKSNFCKFRHSTQWDAKCLFTCTNRRCRKKHTRITDNMKVEEKAPKVEEDKTPPSDEAVPELLVPTPEAAEIESLKQKVKELRRSIKSPTVKGRAKAAIKGKIVILTKKLESLEKDK